MAFTLRVFLSGLGVFVPNRDFDDLKDPPDRTWLLFPDVLAPRVSSDGKAAISSHYPRLQFKLENLRDSKVDFMTYRGLDAGDPQMGLCMLKDQDVTIWPDGKQPASDSLRPVNGPPPDPMNLKQGEDRYLYWLPKMAVIAPGRGDVQPSLLGPLGSPNGNAANGSPNPLITTRLQLNVGRLFVWKLTGAQWAFQDLGQPAPAPAPAVMLPMPVELALELEADEEVAILLTEFGQAQPRKLVLGPPAGKPYDDVEIRLMNREIESTIGLEEPDVVTNGMPDPDFSVYYDLAANGTNPGQPIPVPHFADASDPRGGDHRPCTPAVFKPVPIGSAIGSAAASAS
jgi:hypothetical protein